MCLEWLSNVITESNCRFWKCKRSLGSRFFYNCFPSLPLQACCSLNVDGIPISSLAMPLECQPTLWPSLPVTSGNAREAQEVGFCTIVCHNRLVTTLPSEGDGLILWEWCSWGYDWNCTYCVSAAFAQSCYNIFSLTLHVFVEFFSAIF
jgi:hypothetical protein